MNHPEEWITLRETEQQQQPAAAVEKTDFIPLFNEEDLRELSDVFDKED